MSLHEAFAQSAMDQQRKTLDCAAWRARRMAEAGKARRERSDAGESERRQAVGCLA